MTTRNKREGWYLVFLERDRCFYMNSPQRVSNAALIMSFSKRLIFSEFPPHLRCSHGCGGCRRREWLTGANWILHTLKCLPSACQKTVNTEQEVLKSHSGGDAAPHKSNEAIPPHYPVASRASAAFVYAFKAFFRKKIQRKILKILWWQLEWSLFQASFKQ